MTAVPTSRPLDALIGDLGADLTPVRRLSPPLVRAGLFVAAIVLLAAALASCADLAAVARRLRTVPDMWLAVVGSTLTAVLGAVAAFELSCPDRGRAWSLLPLPALALWVGASGMGCLRGWTVPGTHDASMHESMVCVAFIVGLSLPLSALMIAMVRRACPLMPALTAAVGGLAVAGAAATLLNLFHPYDAAVSDLLTHVFAVALVIGANQALGGRLLSVAGLAGK